MSLANKISLVRILLVPCIVASLLYYTPERDWLRWVAFGLFLAGVISDGVDGFVARSQRQQSQLGTLLDPLADKFLILGTLISLSTIRAIPEWMRLPGWFNLIIISRDVVLVAGTVVLFLLTGKLSVRPSWVGKCTIVAQMAVIPMALLGMPGLPIVLMVVAGLTVVSGLGYMWMATKMLS